MRTRRISERALAVGIVLLIIIGVASPLSAQDVDHPPTVAPISRADDESAEPEPPITEENWVDPRVGLGLLENELEPVPEFDFALLHESVVFASGVDELTVENDPLPDAELRHLRVLQLAATLRGDLAETRQKLRELRPQVREFTENIRFERAEEQRLSTEILLLKNAIAALAIQEFIDDDDTVNILSGPVAQLLENREIGDQLREGHFIDVEVRETELVERQTRRARLELDRVRLRRIVNRTERHRDLRNAQLTTMEDLSARTAAGYTELLHSRLSSIVDGTDIPLVTFNAYVIASRVLAIEQPNCGIDWSMLAGIGRIESQHGLIFNNELDVDGNPSDLIRGPALDGRILSGAEFLTDGAEVPPPSDRTEAIQLEGAEGVEAVDGAEAVELPVIKRLALISDTDGGRLDADTTYDRAVGPMQFIPQTWRTYEADANLDDIKDPQNVYDASLASARYLCNAAGSMTNEEGERRAYFAYNHDEEYTENVFKAGIRYAKLIDLPDDVNPLSTTSELGVFDPPDLEAPAAPRLMDVIRDLVTLRTTGETTE